MSNSILYYCRVVLFALALPLLMSQAVWAQGGTTITGQVIGDQNDPLPGVAVVFKGTTTGASTDIEGRYSLSVPSPTSVLVFSYVGYTSQEVPINNQTTINITLAADVRALSEVVVVGYGTVKKSDLTGAVATVEPAKINQVATVDVNQALQGKVAGVQITPNSGAPGSASRVRIRGVGSFGNSDPLYVVDGYPTTNIDYISPNDIASMEVLKDASATAIYGNRGANGVILITTKKGKAGKPVFTFNTYAGVQNPWKRLDLTNAAEYATLYLEAYINDGTNVTDPTKFNAPNYSVLRNAMATNQEGTDWQNEVIKRNALIQNYSFSVNGGTEKSRFGFSATWFDQQGTVLNTGLKRFLTRINNDYTFNKRISAGWSVAYTNARFTNYAIDQYSGVLPTAIVASPITPAWDPVTNNYGETTRFSTGNNPLRLANELKTRNTQQNRVVATIYGEAGLLEGLKFRSNFGGELYFNKINNYAPQFNIAPAEQRTVSSLYDERQQGNQWTWSNFFTYTKEIGEHSLNAMVGTEAQTAFNNNLNVTGYNILNDPSQYYYIGAAKQTNFQAGTNAGHNSLLSFFGRVNYAYQGKYLVTATIRRDASSRFAKENRVGVFPSFSLGWNIHQEDFLQDVTWLSNLKLRAGYGEVGNQNIPNTAALYVVVPQQRYTFNGVPVEGRANTTLQNPDLLWETSKMSNFGVDAGFLNNRVSVSLEYFIKKTSDMIVTPPIPSYIGALAPSVNAGDMDNRGLEVALGYNKKEGDFRYDFSLNASFIKNKVASLGGGQPFSGGDVNRIGYTTRTEEGQVLSYFYGRKTDGIFNDLAEVNAYVGTNPETGAQGLIQPNAKPGDVKFVDINSDGKIDDKDRVKLGSALPDFSYGFNAFLEYKNFDFKLFFQGLYGNETVNALSVFNENPSGVFNSYKDRMDRWTPENPGSNEPRMTVSDPNGNITFSDRYVENGSYLRLRNIQLGYTVPQSFINRIGVKALRVYISADNLLTLTKYRGYEPEVGEFWSPGDTRNPFYWGVDMATYPQARTFIGGLNITF